MNLTIGASSNIGSVRSGRVGISSVSIPQFQKPCAPTYHWYLQGDGTKHLKRYYSSAQRKKMQVLHKQWKGISYCSSTIENLLHIHHSHIVAHAHIYCDSKEHQTPYSVRPETPDGSLQYSQA